MKNLRRILNLLVMYLWLPASLLAANQITPLSPAESGVVDRREEVAQASQLFRAAHFPDGKMPPKHDFSRLQALPQSQSESPIAKGINPTRATPGGIGYGLWYTGGTLTWSNNTVLDFYVVTPSNLGQVPSTLYLTSTCRSQKGTESLITYWGTTSPAFAVYDWSHTDDPWQVQMNLAAKYLKQRPDEFGIQRQMTHIRNGTYYLGGSSGHYQFENVVMLFDFSRNGWDLMYATNYWLTSLTNNYYNASTGMGTWGPIIETFDSYTNVVPVGFDLCRLFQDGHVHWLGAKNTSVEQNGTEVNLSWSTNWQLLATAPNTSFVAAVSTNHLVSSQQTNFGTLSITANTNAGAFWLNPNVGMPSTGWVSTPVSNVWDLAWVGLPPRSYGIDFAPVPGLATPAPQNFSVSANTVATISAVYATNHLAPTIVQAPLDQDFLPGSNVVLSAAVTGTAPFWFQWFQNTADLADGHGISGANSNVLTITDATSANAGSYFLVATNQYGAITSSVAELNLVTSWPQEFFTDAGGPLSWTAGTANWGNVSGGPYTNLWQAGSSAVFEGTGGLVNVANVSAENVTFNGTGYNLSGGAITFSGNSTITVAESAAIGSVLSGQAVGITVTGSGILTLAGANTFSGSTLVSNGWLLVNGALGVSSVIVASNSVLGGTGIIPGATTVQNGATLSPGIGGLGQLTLSNVLTLDTGSTTRLTINRTAGTQAFGHTAGMNTVFFGGTLVVTNLSGTFQDGDSFKLFSASAYAGAFTHCLLPELPSALMWDTNNLNTAGTLSVVEPPAPALTGIAQVGSAGIQLSFGGNAGLPFRLLRSTNLATALTNWVMLTNGTFGAGAANFLDGSATDRAAFYRIVSP